VIEAALFFDERTGALYEPDVFDPRGDEDSL
jgi:hypothetical protein